MDDILIHEGLRSIQAGFLDWPLVKGARGMYIIIDGVRMDLPCEVPLGDKVAIWADMSEE